MNHIRIATMAALLTAAALTAWGKSEVEVLDAEGAVTSLPLNTGTKLSFGADGVTVTNGTPSVFPYAKVSMIRFKTPESGVADLTRPLPFGLRENPVRDALRLTGDTQLPARLAVTALDGRVIINLPEWNGQDVDASALQPGIYLLTVNNQSLKFIKK